MTLAQDLLTTWLEPDGIAPRGTVVVLPGRGESAPVYERLGRRLSGEAYRVQVAPAPAESADRARAAVLDALETSDPGLPRVVLGVDAGCIALHASDLAVALVALDARVRLHGPVGNRTLPVSELHVRADVDPTRDNVLAPGELITHLEVPLTDARSALVE